MRAELLELSVLYGLMLFIWVLIKPVYRVLHKKDFIKYWNIDSVVYWILVVIAWGIYKLLGLYPFFDWLLLSIVPCVISNIYFMVFRFFSNQEIIEETLSKNEKKGIVVASFIHFLIAPAFVVGFLFLLP